MKKKKSENTIIASRYRRLINTCIRRSYKNEHQENYFKYIVGCDINYFRYYFESKFTDGMNWKNYGEYGWHVDHIIPCFYFNLYDINELLSCFHYSNLQPLSWKENLKKGKKCVF